MRGDGARHQTEQVGGTRKHMTIRQKQDAKYMFNWMSPPAFEKFLIFYLDFNKYKNDENIDIFLFL